MQQYVLQYVQVALGPEWPSFFLFLFGETKFTHARCRLIFSALESGFKKDPGRIRGP